MSRYTYVPRKTVIHSGTAGSNCRRQEFPAVTRWINARAGIVLPALAQTVPKNLQMPFFKGFLTIKRPFA